MKRGLRTSIVAASVALALAMGGVFAILLLSIGQLRASGDWASHSEQVVATANQLEIEVLDLETGLRGFIITRQERFLEPLNAALVALPRDTTALERLVSDSAQQEARAKAITGAGLSYISQYVRPTVAVARANLTKATAIVRTGAGKRRIDAIRGQFASFAAAENLLLLARRSTAHAAADRAVAVGVGGLIGVLLLILLFAGYLGRSIIAPVRRVTASAAQLARGELSARALEGGGGEVAELGRTFNAMASSLQESRDELEKSQNVVLELQAAELEQQRTALSSERLRFEAVLEQMVGGVLVAEAPSGRILLASNQAELILGQPLRTELFDGHLPSSVPVADRHALEHPESPLARALRNGETTTALAMDVSREDGTIVSVEVNAAPVKDEHDRIIAAVVTFHDVTDRNLAEDAIRSLNLQLERQNKNLEARHLDLEAVNAELEAANGELNAFSYSVSHDLRAPLRAIDGFSRIVLKDDEGTLTDAQRRYLGLVRDNTQVMGSLIDDLLSFSRLGTQALQRSTVHTAELVEQVESELAAGQNGRTIEFANGELPTVQGDPSMLRQVFVNLLGNALKYSRESEHIRVAVSSERRDGELVFLVRDNGVGFDMRYADKLFQVFQRLHRAEDYEGTGVGLAIVQRIITRHGGRVWAEGKPNEGATFYFTLNGGAP